MSILFVEARVQEDCCFPFNIKGKPWVGNGTKVDNGVVIKVDSGEVIWVVVNGVETRVGNGEETKEANGVPHQIKEDGAEIRVVGVITKAETWAETWVETWADGHNREETKVVGITKAAEEEDGTMDGDQ